MSLRLANVNIERSRHLDLVAAFLDTYRPDVVCMQEVCEPDIAFLTQYTGEHYIYAPMTMHPNTGAAAGPALIGVALFSHTPFISQDIRYYAGSHERALQGSVREFAEDHPLVVADVTVGGEMYRVVTTHFTWTEGGQANDLQRRNLDAMIRELDTFGDVVVVGDFNAPRGGEIFSKLAEKYTDNIPAHITTTIDGTLHRAGDLQLVVDGLFTTPAYAAHDVALVSGLSDHMAVTARIEKI